MIKKLILLSAFISTTLFASEYCDMREKITTHTLFNLVSLDMSQKSSSVETKKRLCTTVECTFIVDAINSDIYNNKEFHIKGSSQ